MNTHRWEDGHEEELASFQWLISSFMARVDCKLLCCISMSFIVRQILRLFDEITLSQCHYYVVLLCVYIL
jgi:hypothetical protein